MSKNTRNNDELLKNSELTKYLMDRYDLRKSPISAVADKKEAINYDTKPYVQTLTRIMQKVTLQVRTSYDGIFISVQGKSLWDILESKGTPHRISLRDFYLYCFNDWAAYLEKNLGENDYNKTQLEKDKAAVMDLWRHEREKTIAHLQEEFSTHLPSYPNLYYISDQELRERTMYMMLKALFEREYTPIDEEKLRADMEHAAFGVDEDNPTEEDLKIHAGIYEHPEGVYYHRLEK